MNRPSRPKRAPRPLNSARLEELALAYVARFATSAARLEGYLRRKLGERGWEGEGESESEAPVPAIVERFVAAGYIDDAAFARARSGSLLRRGFGARRIAQALDAAGIAAPDREEAMPAEGALRQAALVLARKRRFGPFGAEGGDRARREKQIAAMVRAGHRFDFARALVEQTDAAQAEAWAAELDPDAD